MGIILIVSFYSLWLVLGLLYAINRSSLGALGKWLHRYAWLNEWSMFTNQNFGEKTVQLLIADFDLHEEDLEWQIVDSNQIKSSTLVLNPNFKLEYFINRCIKKIHVAKKVDAQAELNQDVFEYLCAVVLQFPNKKNAKFRKVKIEKRTEQNLWVESICSKPFEL